MSGASRRELLAQARAALGLEHLVLAIHDASFPSRADEETGRGSPYSRGARDLLGWAEAHGFTGVQLGPQGAMSFTNPSPYDGAAFSRSVTSIALWPLAHDPAWAGILDARVFDEILRGAPTMTRRADHRYAWGAHRRALADAHARARAAGAGSEPWRRFEAFRRDNAWWLERDATYEALTARFGTDDWTLWPAPPYPAVRQDEPDAEWFAFAQFVAHSQHAELVAWAERIGMRLFGDLQIGTAHRDRWQREELYLRGYVMGAPPSRTNRAGQPWGYPVLHPGSADATALLRARVTKMLSEFHGIRIDHPHGLVCPWVYRTDTDDPVRAVQEGARLFESPALPDHPELALWAIARPEQIDRSSVRYADGWVVSLEDEQVDRYARLIDVVVTAAVDAGRSKRDVAVEVLSTCPYPLARVMQRFGLGRFRVTQKADPRRVDDVYRTALAEHGDWVMLGNHDTPPIWTAASKWPSDHGKIAAWCDYLEARLGKDAVDRAAVAADPAALAQPMLADLFACAAGYVAVFFADLFGATEVYNTPGVVSEANWTLRADRDFADVYSARTAVGRALDVPRAMATALRARGHDALAQALEALGPIAALKT